MSIASSSYAEYANEEKKRWTRKLKLAIMLNDSNLLLELLKEMEEFEFGE